jgi:uncharacterized protein (DUF1778 family)
MGKLEALVLSDESWDCLIKIIENPSDPNDNLKNAFHLLSKIVEKSERA